MYKIRTHTHTVLISWCSTNCLAAAADADGGGGGRAAVASSVSLVQKTVEGDSVILKCKNGHQLLPLQTYRWELQDGGGGGDGTGKCNACINALV